MDSPGPLVISSVPETGTGGQACNSLDEPDKEVNTSWIEEASRRLKAHRDGKTKGIPFKEVFSKTSKL